jgi:hypothetical protein
VVVKVGMDDEGHGHRIPQNAAGMRYRRGMGACHGGGL